MARVITKNLPCRLTTKEIQDRSRDLLTMMTALDEDELNEASRRKAWKKDRDEDKKAVVKIRQELSSGVESRDVRCEERRNDQLKTMEVLRLDSKEAWLDNVEVVNSRPLTPNEQQIELLTDHRRDRDGTIPADDSDSPEPTDPDDDDDDADDEDDADADNEVAADPAFEGIEDSKPKKRGSPKRKAAKS